MLVFLGALLPVHARELKIGVGNFPPYFSEKGTDGLFNELIKETFNLMPQYSITLVPQMSNYRLVQALNTGAVDGAANIFTNTEIKGCRSDPIFRFTDVAVTLKAQNLHIDNLADLKGKRIITYQGARTFLGEGFAQVTGTGMDVYREVPQPIDQAKSLVAGGADVSVGDMYIFLNTIGEWSNPAYRISQFEIHKLFPDIYSQMGFLRPEVCGDFNTALRALKKSGKFEQIYLRHLQRLQQSGF